MTPDKRIQEIRERVEKATPNTAESSPERICHDGGDFTYEIQDEFHLVSFYENSHEQRMKAKFNAEFYYHSKQDIPFLLSEVDRLREENERYRAAINKKLECSIGSDCEECESDLRNLIWKT